MRQSLGPMRQSLSPVRQRTGLVVLFTLVLAACGGTSPSPSAIPPSATPAAAASPTIPATKPRAIAPTPTTSAPATGMAPTPTAAESPWPASLRELDFRVPAGNSYSPRALALHPGLGRLYARTHTQGFDAVGQVVTIDLDSGEVLAAVETGPDSSAEGALAVDTTLDRIYALNAGDGTCSVLDAPSLGPITTLADVDVLALDPDGGRLYVSGSTGLRVLDAKTYDPLEVLPPLSGLEFLALALDPTGGRLYAAIRDANGYGLVLYDAASLQTQTTIPLPGEPHALLPDPARGRLYLSLDDGDQGLLWSLDSDGRLIEERPLSEDASKTHLALDPEGDRLFLGRDAYGNYGVAILDLQTGQEVDDVPLAFGPKALAWEPGSARLLLSHTYAHRIDAIDIETSQTTTTFPTAIELVDLAVDPGRGHLYVTDTGGRLHVLDSETDEELAVLRGEGCIALDIPHGRLYTGGEGADRVRIFDADALGQDGEIPTQAKPVADAYHGQLYLVRSGVHLANLETMTITTAISDTLPQNPGFSPNPAATDALVDPGSGRLFAIINNGVPGSNGGTYLYVYEPESYQKVLTDTERSPLYLDVDPHTGRAYVSRIHMTQRSTSLLEDGQVYTARLEGVFGALRVDPTLGRVYLTVLDDAEGQMLVLDADNLHVLGSIPIPGGFTLRALDPERHLLYLATGEARVQIWSATGGELSAAAEPTPADLAAEEPYELYMPPGDGPLFARDKQYRLYRSDDEGRSWGRITGGLPNEWVLDLGFSPDFARDGVLFAALATADEGFGVWKSTDAGLSWRMASIGLTDLTATGLAVSPDFGQDQTLFATTRQDGLFRSTDAGQSWVSLTERYYPPEPYHYQPGALALSAAYGQDHTLFVNHGKLYRSTDGGDAWTAVLPGIGQLALSPDFGSDSTVYGWSGDTGVLRSTDGGDAWEAVSVGLSLHDYGSGRVILPPDHATSRTLYFLWSSSQADPPLQVFRSTDAATTWEQLSSPPLLAATPLVMADGGRTFAALDASGRLVRWPLANLAWQAATLPPLAEIAIESVHLSPSAILALSGEAGILRSNDAGLTWTDAGFPVRATYGDPLELLILPPDTFFVGSALGLYRAEGEGPWTIVEGGLPQGVDISTPVIGEDGALRVLAGGKHTYLSIDGGHTWTQPIPELPYAVDRDDPLFSPAFATDHTAYVGISWQKPQRTFGDQWEEFGPAGEWSLSGLYLSPAFDQDSLLLLVRDGDSLWRSDDRGDTWTQISGPWQDDSWLDVTFSAAYAQDAGLFARTDGPLYRSTDQGATWSQVLDLAPQSIQIVFSPDYARDSTIVLSQGHTLYRSGDRGQTWKTLPTAPWGAHDEFELQFSPTWSQDSTLLAWRGSGPVYQSSTGGASWQDVSNGLPGASIRQVLFSPDYAQDGLVYLVPHDGGLYKRVGGGPWLPVTEKESPSTPQAGPTPTPKTTATPMPLACATEPVRFHGVWLQARSRLGCPQQPEEQVFLAEQAFERGRMIWDSSTGQIYVLEEPAAWQAFDDTWMEGVDPAYDPALPPPPQQPQRGFGKVWREHLGGPQAAIGWAVEDERPVNGWRQRFELGWLFWTDAVLAGSETPGVAYLLYTDGTWQAVQAPAP